MVFTAAQTTAFFEADDQMALPAATRIKLQDEGITGVEDLGDFDKTSFEQVTANLKNPGGRIPNPDPGAAAGATIPRPPFTFGAKSRKRLLVACELVRFYNTIDRPLTAGNMRWNPIIKNFEQQWKALEARKDDVLEVPKISKTLTVIKWTEAFRDYLQRKIGTRTIPLAYVTREDADVPVAAPDLMNGAPHSQLHGSVVGDLIARASHNHPLFREDNAEVYYKLEQATRTTSYAASIKPFQRAKNGRGAWFSIVGQYAGQDKWLAEIKRMDELLHNRVWKGQSNFSLEKFIAQHRNAYVSMQQCVAHVTFQLPNEFTRVTYLLDAIQCNDPGLQAAMALVRADDQAPHGKMHNFENTASYLLPYDPVAKKRSAGTKRGVAAISEVTAEEEAQVSASSGSKKPAIGKTGVEFRFYKPHEYRQLTDEQKTELKEHRESRNKGDGAKKDGGNKDRKKRTRGSSKEEQKKWIAAAVQEKMEERKDDAETEADFRRYILSVVSSTPASSDNSTTSSVTTSSGSTPKTAPLSLQSILGRVKRS